MKTFIRFGVLALATSLLAFPCPADEPVRVKDAKAEAAKGSEAKTGEARPAETKPAAVKPDESKPTEPNPSVPKVVGDPFAKWEKEIAAIEARDAKDKPAPGGVLFYGSSSIRMWNLKESFPELAAVNHGFGGSQMVDAVYFFARLVPPLKPRLVVLYEGDNDLAAGRTPEQVAADLREFLKLFHAALPESRLVVISVKPSPSRWKLFEKQKETNKLLQAAVSGDKLTTFVDVTSALLDSSGNTRPELYRDDKLHLSAAGYKILNDVLAPLLK